MDVLRIILTVMEVIASVLLILVVLVQSGKEAGLSGAIAGNSDSFMSKNKRGNLDKILASATKWIGLAWVLLTLALSLIPMA
jgi:preprotein translocase subunit SecG